jgi:hypothetical protein
MPEQPHLFSKIAEELVDDLRGGLAPEEPRRAVKRPTQDLATVIDQLMTKHQIGRESPEHRIREQWPAIVGVANASFSHAVAIEKNRLIVIASHAVVRNELFLHRDEIIGRLRLLPGCETLKSLNLRNG